MPIGVDRRWGRRRPLRRRKTGTDINSRRSLPGIGCLSQVLPRGTCRSDCRRLWNVYNYLQVYTSMRTNIVIDDKLMRDALRATGLKTKREAVEEGLRTLLRLRRQAGLRRLRGKLDWQGGLNAMRSEERRGGKECR